jgi:hypothetical protein
MLAAISREAWRNAATVLLIFSWRRAMERGLRLLAFLLGSAIES